MRLPFRRSKASREQLEQQVRDEFESAMAKAQPPTEAQRTWVLPAPEVPDLGAARPRPPRPRPQPAPPRSGTASDGRTRRSPGTRKADGGGGAPATGAAGNARKSPGPRKRPEKR